MATSKKKTTTKKSSAKKRSTKTASKKFETSISASIERIESGEANTRKKYTKECVEIAHRMMSQGFSLRLLALELGVNRATVLLWRKQHAPFSDAIRQGKEKFLLGLPRRAIEWLSNGRTLTSFAGQCNMSKETLYQIINMWPELKEAVEIGRAKGQEFWEDLAIKQAKGELTVHLGDIPVIAYGSIVKDDDGNIIKNPNIQQARYSDRALIFVMQNQYDDYKPQKDVSDDDSDSLKEAIEDFDRLVSEGKIQLPFKS